MAAPPVANDSGMPLIAPYSIVYVSQEFYEVSRIAETITWTYSVVLAVAVWDWLVSLRAEYDRIWKRGFSVISFLYIGSRYYSMAVIVWLTWIWDYCQQWYRWSCGLAMAIEIFAVGILLIRTWAFTGRKPYYLALFVALYLVQIIYMTYVTFKALELVPWLRQGQTKGKCITAGYSGNQLATGFWVAPLGFTIILTAVTMIESVRIQARIPASKRSPLLRVFLRDGLMYLVVITLTNVTNMAFFAQKDQNVKGAAMAFQFLLASLMSCRLVLSLRDSEAFAMNSAAASLATKSFWRSGYNGGNTDGSKTCVNRSAGTPGNNSSADGFGAAHDGQDGADFDKGINYEKDPNHIPFTHSSRTHQIAYMDPIAVK